MQAQLYNTRNATKPSKTYRKKKTKQKKNNYKQILFSLRLLFLGIFFEIVFSEYSQEKQSCSYETRSIVRLNSDSFDIYTCVLGFFFYVVSNIKSSIHIACQINEICCPFWDLDIPFYMLMRLVVTKTSNGLYLKNCD